MDLVDVLGLGDGLILGRLLFALFALARLAGRLCRLGNGLRRRDAQVFQIQELVAALAEGLRRLFLAHADHVDALLAQMDGERGIVAVAGNQNEAVIDALVQKLDRIDDHCHIGRVLAGHVVKLLLRFDGQALDLALPALEVILFPVAVGALDHDAAQGIDLLNDRLQLGKLGVVGVDQHGDLL